MSSLRLCARCSASPREIFTLPTRVLCVCARDAQRLRARSAPRSARDLQLHSPPPLEDDQVMASQNSFITRTRLSAGGAAFDFFSLPALERAGYSGVARLPYSLKILLENLLRCEDGRFVHADHIQTL